MGISSVSQAPNILILQARPHTQSVSAAPVDSDGDHDGSGPDDTDRGGRVDIKA